METSWDSKAFVSAIAECREEMARGLNSYYKIRDLRVNEYNNTIRICSDGYYIAEEGKRIDLPDDSPMRLGTRFYSHSFTITPKPTQWKTIIEVHDRDCLDEALRLKANGYNPVVLNMANRRTPGGGVRNGAGAQEEGLFRRTNLFRALYQFIPFAPQYGLKMRQEQYPMDPNWGGIYTPDATLFREDEAMGYRLMNETETLSFVSVAGINRPELEDATHMTAYMAEGTKNKMRTILRIALDNGHDAIVLGALGCGAFCNPPSHVAKLFHEVFEEAEFKDQFAIISFAIIDDHNAHREHNPEGNVVPFRREFGTI